MGDKRRKIVIAAMLHDIGKFWQRADEHLMNSDNMVDYQKHDNAEIVPTFEQKDGSKKPGYQHALWTHKFLIKHESFFETILEDFSSEEFALLSAKHHRPDNNKVEQAIISLADKWASKNERVFIDFAESEDKERKMNHEYWGQYAYKKIPLHNIFDLVNRPTDFELKWPERSVFSFKPLNVLNDNSIFSNLHKGDVKSSRQPDYAKLWNQFEEDFENTKESITSYEQAVVAIDALLLKYTWCIPSSTMDMPYASLYQHNKMVAGMSSALYDFYQDHESEFENGHWGDGNYGWQMKLKHEARDALLMTCLDLSGIQKYIYNISTSGAAKSLKGRSYSLQLLMKSCINEILNHKDIELTLNNIIYASGGKAFLLLPNTEKCKNALKEIRNFLETKFYDSYGLGLYPAIGWVSFRYEIDLHKSRYKMSLRSNDSNFKEVDDKNGHEVGKFNLGELWRSVSDEASRYKGQKFHNHLKSKDFYDKIFKPNHDDNQINEKLDKCAVTGLRSNDLVDINKSRTGSEELLVSKEVYDQIEIGKKLKRAETISEYYDSENTIENETIRPAGLHTTYKVNSRWNRSPQMIQYGYNALNEVEHGLLFYGGNIQPLNKDDSSKTYEDICQISGTDNSTMLGVLKMDVDNLGKIFIQGLPEEDRSFSALATLSFYLETFFSGYINQIRNSEQYKDHMQIIYSGGDDVFAVGRWDKVIEFAITLDAEFKKFTNRDEISLSGGIAIVRQKFPIAKASDLASEAEKASKNFKRDEIIVKNAFTFFGETVSWKDEMETVQNLKSSLLTLILTGKISSGLLQKLQGYKVQKDEAIRNNTRDFSYKWHSAYTIARMVDPLKKNREENQKLIDFLYGVKDKLMHDKQYGADRYLDLLGLAARWTEYLFKIKKMEKNGVQKK